MLSLSTGIDFPCVNRSRKVYRPGSQLPSSISFEHFSKKLQKKLSHKFDVCIRFHNNYVRSRCLSNCVWSLDTCRSNVTRWAINIFWVMKVFVKFHPIYQMAHFRTFFARNSRYCPSLKWKSHKTHNSDQNNTHMQWDIIQHAFIHLIYHLRARYIMRRFTCHARRAYQMRAPSQDRIIKPRRHVISFLPFSRNHFRENTQVIFHIHTYTETCATCAETSIMPRAYAKNIRTHAWKYSFHVNMSFSRAYSTETLAYMFPCHAATCRASAPHLHACAAIARHLHDVVACLHMPFMLF